MTEPTQPSRWTQVRGHVADALRRGRESRWGNPQVWISAGFAVLCVIALAAWVNSLTAPVSRAGLPTATISPLPATTAPTPTPVETPSASESPTPTPSALPTLKSSGKFDTAGVSVAAASSSGELRSFTVRVETTAKLKADRTGKQVAGVLNDPRSWAGSGGIRFALVGDPGKADFTVTLAAPGTAAKLCKLDAAGTCTDGADVVIDARAWKFGSTGTEFGSSAEWQAYLVNHGLGHLLGEKRADCTKKAKPAPVMMLQAGDLGGCTANAWPYP